MKELFIIMTTAFIIMSTFCRHNKFFTTEAYFLEDLEFVGSYVLNSRLITFFNSKSSSYISRHLPNGTVDWTKSVNITGGGNLKISDTLQLESSESVTMIGTISKDAKVQSFIADVFGNGSISKTSVLEISNSNSQFVAETFVELANQEVIIFGRLSRNSVQFSGYIIRLDETRNTLLWEIELFDFFGLRIFQLSLCGSILCDDVIFFGKQNDSLSFHGRVNTDGTVGYIKRNEDETFGIQSGVFDDRNSGNYYFIGTHNRSMIVSKYRNFSDPLATPIWSIEYTLDDPDLFYFEGISVSCDETEDNVYVFGRINKNGESHIQSLFLTLDSNTGSIKRSLSMVNTQYYATNLVHGLFNHIGGIVSNRSISVVHVDDNLFNGCELTYFTDTISEYSNNMVFNVTFSYNTSTITGLTITHPVLTSKHFDLYEHSVAICSTCDGKFNSDFRVVCSGEGTCVAPDQCLCNRFYDLNGTTKCVASKNWNVSSYRDNWRVMFGMAGPDEDIQWTEPGYGLDEITSSVLELVNDGILYGSSSAGYFSGSGKSSYISKFDFDGNLLKSRVLRLHSNSGYHHVLSDISRLPGGDNLVVFCGITQQGFSTYLGFIGIMNATNLEILRMKKLVRGGDDDVNPKSCKPIKNYSKKSGLIGVVGAQTMGLSEGAFFMRVDIDTLSYYDGKCWNTDKNDRFRDFVEFPDGSFYLGGTSYPSMWRSANDVIYVMVLSPDLNFVTAKEHYMIDDVRIERWKLADSGFLFTGVFCDKIGGSCRGKFNTIGRMNFDMSIDKVYYLDRTRKDIIFEDVLEYGNEIIGVGRLNQKQKSSGNPITPIHAIIVRLDLNFTNVTITHAFGGLGKGVSQIGSIVPFFDGGFLLAGKASIMGGVDDFVFRVGPGQNMWEELCEFRHMELNELEQCFLSNNYPLAPLIDLGGWEERPRELSNFVSFQEQSSLVDVFLITPSVDQIWKLENYTNFDSFSYEKGGCVSGKVAKSTSYTEGAGGKHFLIEDDSLSGLTNYGRLKHLYYYHPELNSVVIGKDVNPLTHTIFEVSYRVYDGESSLDISTLQYYSSEFELPYYSWIEYDSTNNQYYIMNYQPSGFFEMMVVDEALELLHRTGKQSLTADFLSMFVYKGESVLLFDDQLGILVTYNPVIHNSDVHNNSRILFNLNSSCSGYDSNSLGITTLVPDDDSVDYFFVGTRDGKTWKVDPKEGTCETIFENVNGLIVEEFALDLLYDNILYIGFSMSGYDNTVSNPKCQLWRIDMEKDENILLAETFGEVIGKLKQRTQQTGETGTILSTRTSLLFSSLHIDENNFQITDTVRIVEKEKMEGAKSDNFTFVMISDSTGTREQYWYTSQDNGLLIDFMLNGEYSFTDDGVIYQEHGAFLRQNGNNLEILDAGRGRLQYCSSGYYLNPIQGNGDLVCLRCGYSASTKYTSDEFNVRYSTTSELDSLVCSFCDFTEFLDTANPHIDRCRSCQRLEYNPQRIISQCTECPNYMLFDRNNDQEYIDHCFACLENEEEDDLCGTLDLHYYTTPYPPVTTFTDEKDVQEFSKYRFYLGNGEISYPYYHRECVYWSYFSVMTKLFTLGSGDSADFFSMKDYEELLLGEEYPGLQKSCAVCKEDKYWQVESLSFDRGNDVIAFFIQWKCTKTTPSDKHSRLFLFSYSNPKLLAEHDLYETSYDESLFFDYPNEMFSEVNSIVSGDDFYVINEGKVRLLFPVNEPWVDFNIICSTALDVGGSFDKFGDLWFWYGENYIFIVSNCSERISDFCVCEKISLPNSGEDIIHIQRNLENTNDTKLYLVTRVQGTELVSRLYSFDLKGTLETSSIRQLGEMENATQFSSIHRKSDEIIYWCMFEYDDVNDQHAIKIKKIFNILLSLEGNGFLGSYEITITDPGNVLFSPLLFSVEESGFVKDGKIFSERGGTIAAFLSNDGKSRGLSIKQYEFQLCGLGYFPIKLSTGTVCFKQCGPGNTTSGFDTFNCIPCSKGMYLDDEYYGDNKCFDCPPGTYTPTAGYTSSCIPCPMGYYSVGTGNFECVPCPAGTYQDQLGQSSSSSCKPCGKGFFSPILGLGSKSGCESCLPGYFGVVEVASNSDDCQKCSPGTFGNWTQTGVKCFPCPAGTYQPNANSTSCFPCGLGKFSTQMNLIHEEDCILCPRGTFNEGNLKANHINFCTPCPKGKKNSEMGSPSQSNCVGCSSPNGEICGIGTSIPVFLGDLEGEIVGLTNIPESLEEVPENTLREDFWYKLQAGGFLILCGLCLLVLVFLCAACTRCKCLECCDCFYSKQHDAEDYSPELKISTWYGGCFSIIAVVFAVWFFSMSLIEFVGPNNKVEFSSVTPAFDEDNEGLYTLPSDFEVESIIYGMFDSCQLPSTTFSQNGFTIVGNDEWRCTQSGDYPNYNGCVCSWKCEQCYFSSISPSFRLNFDTNGVYVHLIKYHIKLPYHKGPESGKMFEIRGYIHEEEESISDVDFEITTYKTSYRSVQFKNLFYQLVGMSGKVETVGLMGAVASQEVTKSSVDSDISLLYTFHMNSFVYVLNEEFTQSFLGFFSQVSALASVIVSIFGCVCYPIFEFFCFNLFYSVKRHQKKVERNKGKLSKSQKIRRAIYDIFCLIPYCFGFGGGKKGIRRRRNRNLEVYDGFEDASHKDGKKEEELKYTIGFEELCLDEQATNQGDKMKYDTSTSSSSSSNNNNSDEDETELTTLLSEDRVQSNHTVEGFDDDDDMLLRSVDSSFTQVESSIDVIDVFQSEKDFRSSAKLDDDVVVYNVESSSDSENE